MIGLRQGLSAGGTTGQILSKQAGMVLRESFLLGATDPTCEGVTDATD